MWAVVVISPETTASPVVTNVSQPTRPIGSCFITSSNTASEIWSAILSGWPSVTDSEVNRKFLSPSLKTNAPLGLAVLFRSDFCQELPGECADWEVQLCPCTVRFNYMLSCKAAPWGRRADH